MKLVVSIFLMTLCSASAMGDPETPADFSAPGSTVVTQWKGNKKGVFMMYFDDSIPSHIKNVVPELQKRGLMGTFYINPGGAAYKAHQVDWETNIPATGVAVYGNHTMTHQGCKDYADAENEIGPVNDYIIKAFPSEKNHLISYGQPGVPAGKWNITDAERQQLLDKYHLVLRPHMYSAVSGLKDATSILALADKAISSGTAVDILFHGVGGDWIIFDPGEFVKVLDGLVERKDALWITDPISEYQYDTERKSAKMEIISASNQSIQIKVTNASDPQWFDYSLTFQTKVPSSWTKCQVSQGDTKTSLISTNGIVSYDALPNGVSITLEPMSNP